MVEQDTKGAGPLDAAYAEAQVEVRRGRLAHARICIDRAARELDAVGVALQKVPRRGSRSAGLRRRIPAAEIRIGSLANARRRIAELVTEIAALTHDTEAARDRVRAQRLVFLPQLAEMLWHPPQ